MLKIKSDNTVQKAIFQGLDLTFGDTGLVFICGKKESSAKNLLKYVGGIEYLPGLNIELDDFTLDSASKLDDYRLYNIGIVFSNVFYSDNETVLANVLTSCSTFGTAVPEKYIDDCLTKVGLLEFKDTIVSELTEYQLHCLDIARALAKDPKIIIANNPIARLNDEEITKIWKILHNLSKERLVVVGNALEAVGIEIADQIISFEAHEVNHVWEEKIHINNLRNANNKRPDSAFEKVNKFSFKDLFKITSRLITGSIFLMVILALTISCFLMAGSAKDNQHLNFSQALMDNDVKKVILMRNTEKNEFVISQEIRDRLDAAFSDVSIQWGYYIQNDVNKMYPAHKKTTKYNYPESMFRIADTDKDSLYKLVAGSWNDAATGVYISQTEAENYIKYFNTYSTSPVGNCKPLKDLAEKLYPSGKHFNNINELVGENMILAYNTKHLEVLKIAGIFEDNLYSNNLIITNAYTFPSPFPEDPNWVNFDQSQFYSIGVVTLTDDVKRNSEFLDYNATIIRNEKEPLIIKTTLDENYSKLFHRVSNIPGPLNIASIVGVFLTIAGSVILTYLIIGNYRKEFTLARTYGLSKKEIYKVSAILQTIIVVAGFVAGILITFLIQLFTNVGVKGGNAFIDFNYFRMPGWDILIAFAASIVFGVIFYLLSMRSIKKHDYLIY